MLALINSHAAAALQYGIERDFTNRSEWVVLYDMGAASTEAALVRYSSFSVKEYGKAKTYRRARAPRARMHHVPAPPGPSKKGMQPHAMAPRAPPGSPTCAMQSSMCLCLTAASTGVWPEALQCCARGALPHRHHLGSRRVLALVQPV